MGQCLKNWVMFFNAHILKQIGCFNRPHLEDPSSSLDQSLKPQSLFGDKSPESHLGISGIGISSNDVH